MSRPIIKNSTDQSVVIRIVDSTDGTPETAVEHNTAGIDLWYRREGATKTSITEAALAALDSAHTDGGIEHIGDGYYRLDLPDAAVASGVNHVTVGGTVTGMVVIGADHPLVEQVTLDSNGRVDISKIAGQTVTAPTGVTFPGSIASPTNITAGTITTVSGNVVGSVGSVVASVTATLDASQTAAIADKLLGRNISGGADGGRTLGEAASVLRNRVVFDLNSNLMMVYDTDDTTVLFTAAFTTAVRNPITSVDPT